MAQCCSEIPEETIDDMFLHAPEIITRVRSHGSVTDVFLVNSPKKHISTEIPW